MGGAYQDMPPLVDPDSIAGYPPTHATNIPPPPFASYSPFQGSPSLLPGAAGQWGGAGWGAPVVPAAWRSSPGPGLTAAGYPTPANQPFPSWSQSQPYPWNTAVQQSSPWPYHTPNVSDPWRASPSFGANSVLAQAPIADPYFSADPYSSSLVLRNAPPDKYLTPLARSDSLITSDFKRLSHSPQNLAVNSPYAIKRSSSVGATNSLELARRPNDWRQDFKFRTGLAGLLPRRQRTYSSPPEPEFYDDIKRDPHRFLYYNSFNPPVFLDLRDDPMSIKFHELGRAFDRNDLLQYACEPPVHFMRLYHDKLPWYIDVWARNGAGVTIHDLFDQLHDSLMLQIHQKHFYNEEMDDEDRVKIAIAFKERCADKSGEVAFGVRRVDFLRGRVIFEGLLRGRNGMWELKTRKR